MEETVPDPARSWNPSSNSTGGPPIGAIAVPKTMPRMPIPKVKRMPKEPWNREDLRGLVPRSPQRKAGDKRPAGEQGSGSEFKKVKVEEEDEEARSEAPTEVSVEHTDDHEKAQAKASRMDGFADLVACLLYTSPSPRDQRGSRMPSSA